MVCELIWMSQLQKKTAPTWTMRRVKISKTGRALSRSASFPPTKAIKRPSSAGPTVPDTGATIKAAPWILQDVANFLAVLGLSVLISMKSCLQHYLRVGHQHLQTPLELHHHH